MKLYWSTRSPFARKVTIAAHELGLASRIELVPIVVGMSTPNAEVMRANPLSKIPTLILDDGSALYDSFVIIDYLDGLSGPSRLVPDERQARLATLKRHALGNGLLDLLVLWRNERDRPAPYSSPAHLAAYDAKAEAALTALEQDAAELTATPLDIAHIAVGCALSYLDFRFRTIHWRTQRPRLAAWHAEFCARDSVRATEHRDG